MAKYDPEPNAYRNDDDGALRGSLADSFGPNGASLSKQLAAERAALSNTTENEIPQWQQRLSSVEVDPLLLASWDFNPFKATKTSPEAHGSDLCDDTSISVSLFLLIRFCFSTIDISCFVQFMTFLSV